MICFGIGVLIVTAVSAFIYGWFKLCEKLADHFGKTWSQTGDIFITVFISPVVLAAIGVLCYGIGEIVCGLLARK